MYCKEETADSANLHRHDEYSKSGNESKMNDEAAAIVETTFIEFSKKRTEDNEHQSSSLHQNSEHIIDYQAHCRVSSKEITESTDSKSSDDFTESLYPYSNNPGLLNIDSNFSGIEQSTVNSEEM